jgi:hypothetical protein
MTGTTISELARNVNGGGRYDETMMQTGDKFLSVLVTVLIVLAFVLKAVIPQTYRFGLGGRYYRPDSIVFWAVLMVGLILITAKRRR